ncbi:MAG: DUF169 domain-containing protein [Thermotogota bacterium]
MYGLPECSDTLRRELALSSSPIAVSLIRNGAELPAGLRRPRADHGTCLAQCQAFGLARRNRMGLALLKQDMWCPEPVIGYGLSAPPQEFSEGANRFPDDIATSEAARTWAQSFPRLGPGEYAGVLSAPLDAAPFDPQLILIYCRSIQITRLLLASSYDDGREPTCHLSGHAGCVFAVVPPLKTGECAVSIPCMGDRQYAGCQDDELLFTIPAPRLGGILRALARPGTGSVPSKIFVRSEYTLLEAYARLASKMEMTHADGSPIIGKRGSERLPWE